MGDVSEVIDVRVGTDVQSIEEVEEAVRRYGERYLTRVFTPHEIESCGGMDAPPPACAPGLTARFAAKEAVFKLLRPSTAIPRWKEVEVRRSPEGGVDLNLSGTAARLAHDGGFVRYDVSLSHGAGIGYATVVGLRELADGGTR